MDKPAADIYVNHFAKHLNTAWKSGFLTGANYVADNPTAFDDLEEEITWEDLEEWGMAEIIDEAGEAARIETLKRFTTWLAENPD